MVQYPSGRCTVPTQERPLSFAGPEYDFDTDLLYCPGKRKEDAGRSSFQGRAAQRAPFASQFLWRTLTRRRLVWDARGAAGFHARPHRPTIFCEAVGSSCVTIFKRHQG